MELSAHSYMECWPLRSLLWLLTFSSSDTLTGLHACRRSFAPTTRGRHALQILFRGEKLCRVVFDVAATAYALVATGELFLNARKISDLPAEGGLVGFISVVPHDRIYYLQAPTALRFPPGGGFWFAGEAWPPVEKHHAIWTNLQRFAGRSRSGEAWRRVR